MYLSQARVKLEEWQGGSYETVTPRVGHIHAMASDPITVRCIMAMQIKTYTVVSIYQIEISGKIRSNQIMS